MNTSVVISPDYRSNSHLAQVRTRAPKVNVGYKINTIIFVSCRRTCTRNVAVRIISTQSLEAWKEFVVQSIFIALGGFMLYYNPSHLR